MSVKTEKEYLTLCMEFLKRSTIYQEFLQNPASNDSRFDGVKHLHNVISNKSWKLSPHPAARLIDSEEYAARLKADMIGALSIFRKVNKREPSPEELITESYKLAEVMNKNALYIKVETKSVRTLTETRADIGECVKKVLVGSIGKEFRRDFMAQIGYPDATRKLSVEKLTRYLGVYDLKLSGEPWEKIALFMGKKPGAENGYFEHPKTGDDFNKDELIREINRDFSTAKKIISNVEEGDFPGDFWQ